MTATLLAVDAMSGDLGPRVIVPACLAALRRNPSLEIVLVGNPDSISTLLPTLPGPLAGRLHIHPASEVVLMDDPPAQMLRGKPDSSMRVTLQLVRDGQVNGCVSSGNTGALMALSRHVLKVIPGIDRPAIMTALPARDGPVYLLDLGANVDTTADQLVQFALMGSLALELTGVVQPRVALLNIGIESIKGSQQVRQAGVLLEQSDFVCYTGYIEADAVFANQADVVVCDGFVGNVLLKTVEGVARLMGGQMREEAGRTLWRRLLVGLNRGLWHGLARNWSPDRYNGAVLLGVNGLVVKSHGAAGERAFLAALEQAVQIAGEDLPSRLAQRFGQLPEVLRQTPGCDS
ncbi:MAG: phosphate acyltransferase PlsX [Gammaproteobacteria bacterium]|nr:phosphate acyltransferase PlsX [Gammaproteobacteria bacterium]